MGGGPIDQLNRSDHYLKNDSGKNSLEEYNRILEEQGALQKYEIMSKLSSNPSDLLLDMQNLGASIKSQASHNLNTSLKSEINSQSLSQNISAKDGTSSNSFKNLN